MMMSEQTVPTANGHIFNSKLRTEFVKGQGGGDTRNDRPKRGNFLQLQGYSKKSTKMFQL